MTRLPAVLATVAVIAVGATTVPSTADARPRGAAVTAGVIGLAAGAIIGSAIGAHAYGPGYVYESDYAYAPGYAYGPAYAPYAYDYGAYNGAYAYAPGYHRGYRYGESTCDRVNRDRQLVGTC